MTCDDKCQNIATDKHKGKHIFFNKLDRIAYYQASVY